MPVPEARVCLLDEPSSEDAGPTVVRVKGALVTIRGVARQVEGGGIYGDVDVSDPGTLRLTLYDSLPGRPVDAPLPREARSRAVVYEATSGPWRRVTTTSWWDAMRDLNYDSKSYR
jgi:hypothetical protein